jgi:hypothetical protein
MKKRLETITLSTFLLLSGLAFAQPPEEVPPPPPDTGVVNEPAAAPAVVPSSIPVAEPKVVVAPAPAEDKRLKGVSVAPYVGLFPIGYDKEVNLSGNEGGRYFFALTPGIGVETALKTAKDRTLDFSVNYEFAWREYYNKAVTSDRDFYNSVSGGLGIAWNEIIKTKLDALFGYFLKNGGDENGDNYLELGVTPTLEWTLTKQIGFTFKYDLYYANLFTSKMTPDQVNSSSDGFYDLGETERGYYYSDVTGYNTFGTDPEINKWFADNTLALGSTFKPIDGTSLGLTYKFLFARISNDDTMELSAHFITPSIKQNMPWKGGSVSLANEFRFRKWKYDTVDVGDGTTVPKQAFRTSLRLDVEQTITESMTFTGGFRMDLAGSNKDNYADLSDGYLASMGVKIAF